MIRVVLCDDQMLVCEGLRSILSTYSQFQVLGIAHNGEDLLHLVHSLSPDQQPNVILMDLQMPKMNGVQATRLICQQFPQIKILVLSTYDGDEWVFDAIRAGASGYLLKDAPREELVAALMHVAQGNTPVDPKIAGKLFRMASHGNQAQASGLLAQLSEREREILDLISQGCSNAQIANRIYLSEGTVRNYVSRILEKLGVADRTQAALLAGRLF